MLLCVTVAGHCVGAVVAQLSIEPLMNGRDQLRIAAGVFDLSTIGQLVVVNTELSAIGRLQPGKPRHLRAMRLCWPGKVPTLKCLSNFG